MQFETVSTVAYAARTNTVVTAPTGIQVGDKLLIWHSIGGSPPPTPTAPSGFVAVTLPSGTFPISSLVSGFTMNGILWHKTADSGDAAAANFTITHGNDSSSAIMLRYSGPFDSTTPFVVGAPNTGTGSTSTWLGLTTTIDAATVTVLEFDFGDTTADTVVPTGSTPTFTERADFLLSYAATGVLATAGATGNKTHTNNNTVGANGWGTLMFALQPPSGGAAGIVSPVQTFGPSYAASRAASF